MASPSFLTELNTGSSSKMPSYPPVPLPYGSNITRTTHKDTYPAINPTKSDHRGRYIFITGASKGIGLATAISFAKAGAAGIALGARSSFSAIEPEILVAAEVAGHPAPEILKYKLDVTKFEDVQAAAREVEKQWGKLDILINNAGYLSEFVSIVDSNIEEHWKNWEVNIKGVFCMCKEFIPLLLKGSEKTIVNLTSGGANALTPGGSGYQTTKFALLRFTEFIMVDYGDQGILAYSVHPGSVPTDVALNMPKRMHAILTDTPELPANTLVFLTAVRRDWLAGRYVAASWDMPEFLSKEKEIVDGDKLKQRMVV